MSVLSVKRGATPTPRSTLAAAKPYLPTIGAPATVLVQPARISMWGNDVHGDCVTAEEAFAKACNNPEILIPDNQVIAWVTRHGVIEGANLIQVMTWMQNDGFADASYRYDDGPYASVDWTNAGTLQTRSPKARSRSVWQQIRSKTPGARRADALIGSALGSTLTMLKITEAFSPGRFLRVRYEAVTWAAGVSL